MTDKIEDWLSGGAALLRVIEINQRTQSSDGLPVTVVSAEIWEDSVRVVFVTTVSGRRGPERGVEEFHAWSIDDGQGTKFEFSSGGSGGDDVRMYGAHSWRPAPSRESVELRIGNDVLGVDVTVDLAGVYRNRT